MELNVNIDPEQINKMVAEAVLQSAIGVQVEAVVKKHVLELGRSYDNPIDRVVKLHIEQIVADTLRSDYGTVLKERIAEAVSAKMTDEFVSKILESGLRNY